MKTFSIIVPVYNTSKYLEKCLESIINQTFNYYEIIVVNDGSTDNSEKIIDKFCNKYSNIKKINKINGGLSDARNYGIKEAKGEYLLFLDSDDYFDNNLLEKINTVLEEKKYDLVKFGYDLVYDEKQELKQENLETKEYTNEEFFIQRVLNKTPFEVAWAYAYKKSFWDKYNFEYPKGYYHEDLALTPKIILKSKSVYNLNYIGYHYVQGMNSITRNSDYNKTCQRIKDVIHHFDNLYEEVNKYNIEDGTKKIFNSYISNTLILKINELKREDRKEYIKALKKRNVFNLILSKNLKQKIKKLYFKIRYIYI